MSRITYTFCGLVMTDLGSRRYKDLRVVALDGLDAGVGADLHVRGAKERGASVAARDGDDGREHEVLDEGTSDDNLDRHPDAVGAAMEHLLDQLPRGGATVVGGSSNVV
eukprot:5912186-Prymnesium_polylepis.1